MARLIASGMVKASRDVTMDDPQPSPKSPSLCDMGKVQRLDGGGFQLVWGLRYSPATCESLWMER